MTNHGEEMREQVLLAVNQRITRSKRKRRRIMTSVVAVAVVLLVSVTYQLSYNQGFKKQNSQLAQMSAPLGMQSSVVLSDGTRVFLNAGTTLTYPTVFVSKERRVKVEGEAFFEVVHDAKHPFVVEANALNIQVLGTEFNVKTYADEKEESVTLQTGKVEVRMSGNKSPLFTMAPGEQVLYDKETRVLLRKRVDPEQYTDWRERKLHFNSQPFAKIARVLERQFNVNIHIRQASMREVVFSGDFVRKENLDQILKVMSADRRFYYTIDGDQVYIGQEY